MFTNRAMLAGASALLATPQISRAQGTWPNGPIRIVVPFPPGGSTDALARLLQPHLQADLGVSIIVENRGGASGSLGTAQVARAAPDGNTWLIVFDTHAVNPSLIPNMGFDTERDLTSLLLFGTAPMVMTAHRTRPYRSFAEVVAAAKARPGVKSSPMSSAIPWSQWKARKVPPSGPPSKPSTPPRQAPHSMLSPQNAIRHSGKRVSCPREHSTIRKCLPATAGWQQRFLLAECIVQSPFKNQSHDPKKFHRPLPRRFHHRLRPQP